MAKKLSYMSYNMMSMKAKMSVIQKTLLELGYDIEITCIRDKKTVKALMDFQKKHGITPNGTVCEKTFYELDMKQ